LLGRYALKFRGVRGDYVRLSFGDTKFEKALVVAIVIASYCISFLVTTRISVEIAVVLGYIVLFFGIGVVVGAILTLACGLLIEFMEGD